MTVFDLAATTWAQALSSALVHFLWQGALIGLGAFVLLRHGRFGAPARYAIGVGALAAMLAAPLATLALALDRPPALAVTAAAPAGAAGSDLRAAARGEALATGSARAAAPAAAHAVLPAEFWLLCLWLSGVAGLSCRLAGGWFVAGRLGRRHTGPVAPGIHAIARRVAGRLALERSVRLFESARVAVPVTVGWIKPVVLLPAAAVAGLSPAQVEALLAHELAHVRRHDYLVNLLQSAVETLLFYHPAVWWVSRQVRVEREHCCDDLAVAICDRVVYATALSDLAALATPRLALAATDGSLLTRVRRILGRPAQAATLGSGWTPAFALTLAAGIIVPVLRAEPLAIDLPQPPPRASAATVSSGDALVRYVIDRRLPLTTDVLQRLHLLRAHDNGRLTIALTPVDLQTLSRHWIALMPRPILAEQTAQTTQQAAEARAREARRVAETKLADQRRLVEEEVRAREARQRTVAEEAQLKDLTAEYDQLRVRYAEVMKAATAGGAAAKDEQPELRARLERIEMLIVQAHAEQDLRKVAEAVRVQELIAEQAARRERADVDRETAAVRERLAIESRRALAPAEPARVDDVVVLDIHGEPDLARFHTVRADGAIRLPFLGSIVVRDRTAAQIRDAIGDRLAGLHVGSAADVKVEIRRD